MIVVADTSPLNYLLLIDAIDILPQLFREVIIPRMVLTGLSHERAPAVVQAWTQKPPPWLKIADPLTLLPSTVALDAGEAAAISIAQQLSAAAVLIDERRGTTVAQNEGLKTLSTLALLEAAAVIGCLDLKAAIEALRRTNIRLSDDLFESALRRDAERRRAKFD